MLVYPHCCARTSGCHVRLLGPSGSEVSDRADRAARGQHPQPDRQHLRLPDLGDQHTRIQAPPPARRGVGLRVFCKGGSNHGGTGYPMIRLLALVACGTRTIIDATFGIDRYRGDHLCPGPARRHATRDDRAGRPELRRPGADRRDRRHRRRPADPRQDPDAVYRSVADCPMAAMCRGSARSRSGSSEPRSRSPPAWGDRSEVYQLVTTVLDSAAPPPRSCGSTTSGGRSRPRSSSSSDHPGRAGTARPHPCRGRPGDLRAVGHLPGAADRDRRRHARPVPMSIPTGPASPSPSTPPVTSSSPPQASSPTPSSTSSVSSAARSWTTSCPARRPRTNPRVVKRAISNYAANTAQGRIRGPSRAITIEINIIATANR